MPRKKGGIRGLFTRLVKGKSKHKGDDELPENLKALETGSDLSWEPPSRRRGSNTHRQDTERGQSRSELTAQQRRHISCSSRDLKARDTVEDVLEDTRRYSFPFRDDGSTVLRDKSNTYHVPSKVHIRLPVGPDLYDPPSTADFSDKHDKSKYVASQARPLSYHQMNTSHPSGVPDEYLQMNDSHTDSHQPYRSGMSGIITSYKGANVTSENSTSNEAIPHTRINSQQQTVADTACRSSRVLFSGTHLVPNVESQVSTSLAYSVRTGNAAITQSENISPYKGRERKKVPEKREGQAHGHRRSRSAEHSRGKSTASSRPYARADVRGSPEETSAPVVHYHVNLENCDGINIHMSGEDGTRLVHDNLTTAGIKRLSWTEKNKVSHKTVLKSPVKICSVDTCPPECCEIGVQCGGDNGKNHHKPRRWMRAKLPWNSHGQPSSSRTTHTSPERDRSRERHRLRNSDLQQVRAGNTFMPIDKPDDTVHVPSLVPGMGAVCSVGVVTAPSVKENDEDVIYQPTFISRSCQTEEVAEDATVVVDDEAMRINNNNIKVPVTGESKADAVAKPVAVVQPNLRATARQNNTRNVLPWESDDITTEPSPEQRVLPDSESRLHRHRSDDAAVRRRRNRRRHQRRGERDGTEAGDLASSTGGETTQTSLASLQRILEHRDELIRVPGVLIVGARPEGDVAMVYLSRDRPNVAGVVEFMQSHDIARQDYECQILPWRYRSGSRRAAHLNGIVIQPS